MIQKQNYFSLDYNYWSDVNPLIKWNVYKNMPELKHDSVIKVLVFCCELFS